MHVWADIAGVAAAVNVCEGHPRAISELTRWSNCSRQQTPGQSIKGYAEGGGGVAGGTGWGVDRREKGNEGKTFPFYI